MFRAIVAASVGVGLAVALLRRKWRKPSGALWACPPTTCSRRAIMTCVEAGIDFTFVPIDLHKGEHKQPAYLKLQPYGKVPAWVDESGLMLYESRAIMRYLAEGSALVPPTSAARAVMDQWISVEYSYLYPAFMPIYYMRVLKKMPLDEGLVSSKKAEVEATLDQMEARLATSGLAYLAANTFTLADLTYMCYFEVFEAAGIADTIIARPALAAWWGRCRERPTWAYTVSGKVVDDKKGAIDPLGRAAPWGRA